MSYISLFRCDTHPDQVIIKICSVTSLLDIPIQGWRQLITKDKNHTYDVCDTSSNWRLCWTVCWIVTLPKQLETYLPVVSRRILLVTVTRAGSPEGTPNSHAVDVQTQGGNPDPGNAERTCQGLRVQDSNNRRHNNRKGFTLQTTWFITQYSRAQLEPAMLALASLNGISA